MWFVEYNNKYYIILEKKDNAYWVKNLLQNPEISFNVNSDENQKGYARIVNINETELILTVSNLMNKKYGWSNGFIIELNPA